MNSITAWPAKSSAILKAALSPWRQLASWHWLALMLAALSALGAGSCTKEQRLALGLEPLPESVQPASVAAGSGDTPITVTGTNLNNSPVLLFDKTPLSISSATATQIDATVPASDLTQPGMHQLMVVAALPGGPLNSPTTLPFVVTGGTPAPVLALAKSHMGNFMEGQIGATYTITTSNTGSAPTDGSQVTLTDMLPSGLTITGMSGTGWGCTAPPMCMRTDVLAAGSSYPPLMVTVDVATNAPSMVTNQASVSGGGAPPATASDPTTITATSGGANLTASITPSSLTFPQGSNQSYTVMIGNNGTASTTGPVTVTTTLDSHEILTSTNGGSFFNCITGSTGSPVCTSIANLPAGGTGQFTVNFSLASGFTGTVTFSLAASAPGANSTTAMVSTPVQ